MIMKKVLIADDHAIFRDGLKQFIARTVDMVVADEVDNGQDLLAKVLANDYDILILDISMPGRNGLDVLVEVKKIRPMLPVLVLSMHPGEQFALRAFKSGASGYLTKGSPLHELDDALRKIALGKRYISADLVEALVEGLGTDGERSLHDGLSNREYQIMRLIADGNKPQKIAKELGMSVKTVGTYRARILKKLNLKNNVEITRYAMDNRIC